jgi:hypothetical protein
LFMNAIGYGSRKRSGRKKEIFTARVFAVTRMRRCIPGRDLRKPVPV